MESLTHTYKYFVEKKKQNLRTHFLTGRGNGKDFKL